MERTDDGLYLLVYLQSFLRLPNYSVYVTDVCHRNDRIGLILDFLKKQQRLLIILQRLHRLPITINRAYLIERNSFSALAMDCAEQRQGLLIQTKRL